jgi:hypothetical protein
MPEKDFVSRFSTVLFMMLRSTNYSFSHSEQYKTLLKRLIKNVEILNKNLSNTIMRECLKLNLIKR